MGRNDGRGLAVVGASCLADGLPLEATTVEMVKSLDKLIWLIPNTPLCLKQQWHCSGSHHIPLLRRDLEGYVSITFRKNHVGLENIDI